MSAVPRLKQLMSIIDKYSQVMSENDYLVSCNLLNDLFNDNGAGTATSYTSRVLLPMEARFSSSSLVTTHRHICRDSLEALDEFVFESSMNMELDVPHKRYRIDHQLWEARGKKEMFIPRSYETECVAQFRLDHGLSLGANDDEFEINNLRKIGALQDEVSDNDFLCGQFEKLDRWFMLNMKYDVQSIDRAWGKFSSSKSFIDVLDMLQEGIKAIEWRRRIHLNLNKAMIFDEVDSPHEGLHVNMPWISILPVAEV